MKEKPLLPKSQNCNFLIAFLFFLLYFQYSAQAQTPGLIFQPATGTGRNVLDPNLDNYVSKTNTGYVGTNDRTAQYNEIAYRELPQLGSEPLNDLVTGSAGGHTDLAPNPLYMAYDGTRVLFRVRLGGNSSASKGYSFLIDSDGVFNKQRLANGTLVDYTTPSKVKNLGFEFEVVLALNFDVVIYRHRGSGDDTDPFTSNVIWRGSANGGYSQYFQKAIAASTAGGNADYFFDFYVPLSAFSGDGGVGISPTTPLRVTGSTVTSAQTGLEGTISDVGGVDDRTYANDKIRIWRDLIPAFPSTSLQQIQAGEFCQTAAPAAPAISTSPSIRVGTTTITGTSTENGGTITLFRNGTQVVAASPVIVSNGTFSFPLPSGTTLAAGDILTARVTRAASGNCTASTSVSSNTVTVGSQISTCTNAAPVIVNFGQNQKSLNGTTSIAPQTVNGVLTGTTIRVYRDGIFFGTTTASTTANTSGTYDWSYTSGQDQRVFAYPAGSQKNYATLTASAIPAGGGCESPRSNSWYANSGTGTPTTTGTTQTTLTPTPTFNYICLGTTTFSGTSEAGALIYLFINGFPFNPANDGSITPITTANGVNWTVNLASIGLPVGSRITFRAKVPTTDLTNYPSGYEGLSAPTSEIVVGSNCETVAPIITTSSPCPTITSITGTSTEADGTTVIVYRRRTGVSDLRVTETATVVRTPSTATTGNWTAPIIPNIVLQGGDLLYAVATAPGGKTVSPASATITVTTPATAASLGLTLASPIKERATVITGTSTTNGTVNVFIEGQRIAGTATVTGASTTTPVTWSIAINPTNQANLSTGTSVTASITPTGGGCESQQTAAVTVTCVSPSTTPTFTPSAQTVCNNSSATITVANTENGVIYQIYNGSTASGPSMVGNGGTITLSSGNLTAAAVLTVRAFQAGSPDCQATLKGSTSITIAPAPTAYAVTPASTTVCNGTTTTVTMANSESGASYQIQVINPSTGTYVNTGNAVAGTGSAITLTTGAITTSGTFKVVATKNGCSTDMSNTFTVTVPSNALTITPSVQSVCAGNTASVVIQSSESGVVYQLQTGSGGTFTNTGASVTGNGGNITLTSAALSTTGANTLRVLATSGGCAPFALTQQFTVNVTSATPTTFNVTPATQTICSGQAASIALSGSQLGVSYQIFLGSTSVGSIVEGTGNALTLSTGSITAGGTYTVVATNSCGARVTMSGNSVITVTPVPTAFAVTPTTQAICYNNAATLTLAGSETGVSYQVQIYNPATGNYTNTGSAVTGTGSAITLTTGLLTGNSNLKVVATRSGNTCSVDMSNRVFVSVPSANLTVAAITPTICSGGTAQIRVSASETEVFYQLFINGVATGAAVEGTGGDITLTSAAITATTSFTVQATPSSPANCAAFTVGSPVTVTVSAPSNQNSTLVTSTSICSGSTASISLASSEVGVTYQIYNGTTLTGLGVAGTGGAITLTTDALTSNASLRVYAVRSGCSSLAIGSTYAITVTQSPAVQSFTSSQQVVCSGGTVSITLPSSQNGIAYQIYNGGAASGAQVTGTGGSITLISGALTASTTLTVQAVSPGNCGNVTMEGYVAVTVSPTPLATNISASTTKFCGNGGNVTFTATSNLVNGVTYSLALNGTPVGSSIVYNGSNTVSFTTSVNSTGTYTIVASSTNCPSATSAPVTVTVTPTPIVYNVTPASLTICNGSAATITLSNSESGVTYQIYNGSNPSGTAITATGTGTLSLTSAVLSANAILTVKAFRTDCPTVDMNGSTNVTVSPKPVSPTITANTNSVCGNSNVTITASANLVSGVSYQLYRNGIAEGNTITFNGSNAVTFTAAVTEPSTKFTVVASSASCSPATSNEVTVTSIPAPVAPVISASATTFCGADNVVITATGNMVNGVSYRLFRNGVAEGSSITYNGSNTVSFTASVSATTKFTVVATSGSCPSATSNEVTVTVNPAPAAPAITASNASICGGTPVTISVGSPVNGYSYQLFLNGSPSGSPVVANGAVSFTASAAGTYSVRATSNNCDSPVSNEVTITSTPTFTANAGPDKAVCSTNAQGSKTVTLEGNTAPSGTNGAWTVVSKPSGSGNPVFADATNPTTTVSGLNSGAYVFRWTVSSTSCGSQSDEVTITLDCEAEVVSSMQPKAVSEYQNEDVLFTFGDSDAPITAYSIDDNYSIPGVSYRIVNGQLRMYVSNRSALKSDLYSPTIRTTDANGGTSTLSPTVIIGTPLPVTLTSFTASATNNGIKLNWTTASEKDNAYFQVERSQNGKTFLSIGQVKGNGTSNVAKTYSFTDVSAPAGTVYYRLKQVDVDGEFEYSKVVSVAASGNKATAQVAVSPNPFTKEVSISINSVEERIVQVELYDLNQKLIYHETATVTSGKVTLTRDLSRLANGVYILRITGTSLSEVIRVVKED
ncbi:T9SS type A sorting domain-containing protein [Rufibacter aurantiacus]|uniref:Ig-like domain-containing protein n=1 Tax=Rufibacter aurantiacus TaxID=2817374 RepID=UPI001B310529|nr:T9SS type A sorting domain-containing protein [Rufibacter aurantiacus]